MQIPYTRRAQSSFSSLVRWERKFSAALESLETRRLMAVSMDSKGWTNITPSSDTKTIYVSSSSGSDSNSGLSASSPVKTIAKGASLMRTESPDWLLLKKGDVFYENIPTWKKSGRSAEEPMLISSYGTGERPWLKTGATRGFYSYTPFHDLAMIGLKFEANTRNPDSPDFTGNTAGGYGFQTVGPINGLLVEDCSFDHYVYNMSIQGFSGYAKNIAIRRSELTNSYAIDAKCVGLYASKTEGMLLEGNLFDHNGWNEEVPGGMLHMSHNIYLWQDNKNPIIRGNIISDGGSHGLQARGGGTIENNLFLRNPIALLVGNGSEVTPGGVAAKVSGNVFLNSRDSAGAPRGWAIELGNIKAGGGSYVRDNIIAQDNENNFPAIKLETATGASNASAGVGINDVTIERNIVYDWNQALNVGTNFVLGGTGQKGFNDVVIRNNDFQMTTSQKIINQPQAYNAAGEDFSNNRYYNASSSVGWFYLNKTKTSLDTWKNVVEPDAQNKKVTYFDPARDVEKYNASLGGSATRNAFLANVYDQSKKDWDTRYTAAAVNAYVRAGFAGGATLSSLPSQPEPVTIPDSGAAPPVTDPDPVVTPPTGHTA